MKSQFLIVAFVCASSNTANAMHTTLSARRIPNRDSLMLKPYHRASSADYSSHDVTEPYDQDSSADSNSIRAANLALLDNLMGVNEHFNSPTELNTVDEIDPKAVETSSLESDQDVITKRMVIVVSHISEFNAKAIRNQFSESIIETLTKEEQKRYKNFDLHYLVPTLISYRRYCLQLDIIIHHFIHRASLSESEKELELSADTYSKIYNAFEELAKKLPLLELRIRRFLPASFVRPQRVQSI